VRQLKNITEQMSVLSQEREITANALRQFIPQDPESTQLATIGQQGAHSYENERELLFKILYEMRGNVSELRRDMNNLRKQLDESNALTNQLNARSVSIQNEGVNLPAVDTRRTSISMSQPQAEEAIAEEISEPETLNLSDLGRQMIEKALERNGGNRKKAAAELGISDRTLYRKIKQYGLEKD
jgi:DNA-binding NtrC family response regulator